MPFTNVTTAMTLATPMTTPSRVRTERSLFAQSDCSAIFTASLNSIALSTLSTLETISGKPPKRDLPCCLIRSRTGFVRCVGYTCSCRRLDDRCRLHRKVFGGGGKSELRRAVCRITSGTDGSSHLDGKCNRERTASGY